MENRKEIEFNDWLRGAAEDEIAWVFNEALSPAEKVFLLGELSPERKAAILEAIRKNPDVFTESLKDKILKDVFGEETLENYKTLGYKKFASEISTVQVLLHVPEEKQREAEEKPYTKVFLLADVYLSAKPVENGFNYCIGVDPDKNEFFIPYEE